ncbi:hypothetical protein HMI55_002741 [Coelomomyces lativittatus]|nr:hypothetical protein HMI55_002741 [Coelomomyces lativittatus]KAJ1508050.1 hypothetical protein HMI56_007490 [Coelomomyces lativittatus]
MNVAVTPNFPMAPKSKEIPISTNKEGVTSVPVLLAKTDANILQELDPVSLQSVRFLTYTKINSKFKGMMSSAHEMYDFETDEYINYIQEPGYKVKTHVFSVSHRHPEGDIIVTLTTPKASYMHSFSITPQYIIMIMAPYYFKYNGLPIVYTHNVSSALEWFPEEKTVFYVIDRKQKKLVHTFPTDSFFVFHTINAFEHNEQIIVDVCAYTNPNNVQEMTMDRFRNGKAQFEQSYLRRYFLPLNHVNPTVQFDVMSVSSPELPCIHPKRVGRPYRYAYAVHVSSYLPFEALVKHDLENKQDLRWMTPKHYPSEPLFVPKPNGIREDQGVVLSVVLDGFNCQSYLLILDATTMKEKAKAILNGIVPYGFHGAYEDYAITSEGKNEAAEEKKLVPK